MKPIKLVMTLLVRDEEDILEQNLKYHREQGVDHFIITNNLSKDRTTDIIADYQQQGLATVINEKNDNYDQRAWVTRMAHLAASRVINADWIIHSDADEFWITKQQKLKKYFCGLPDEVNVVSAARHDFVCLDVMQASWHQEMIHRKIFSLNPKGLPLPPKVAHRSNDAVSVGQGNHHVSGFEKSVIHTENIEILHFPIRCLAQLENKIKNGGAAYQRNTVLPVTSGQGWRRLYQQYCERGSLRQHYEALSYSRAQLKAAFKAGELQIDTRIADYFK